LRCLLALHFAPSRCNWRRLRPRSSQGQTARQAVRYSGLTSNPPETTMQAHRTAANLVLALALSCAAAAQAGDLVIAVDGVKTSEGQLMVALYDSADGFLKRSVKVGAAPAASGSTTVVIKDVPAGSYGFALFHDANGNGRMDKNMMGIPVEAYAFSNNALGNMGPPSFAQASFAVPAAGAAVTVSLR